MADVARINLPNSVKILTKLNKVMSEVSHLPQLVKVQKESLKETVEFEWHYKLHKCIESI
jgi:hypothetical protein